MRIACITDTRAVGGAERSLVDLAQGVACAGHEALLLAPQPELVAWMEREAPAPHVRPAFSDAYHDVPSAARRAGALLAALRRIVECMPLVVLEAASAGTPAFGSRLSGIPEAIADGVSGLLFGKRSVPPLK